MIRVTRLFKVLVVSAFAALPAVSGAQWISKNGPEPYIRALALSTNNPVSGTNTMFAATLGAGVFKGVDSGSSWTWQQMNAGLPTGRLWTISVDFVNNVLYVGTDGYGVYKSSDGGSTWQPLNGSGGTALGCKVVRNVQFSGTTIWAGTRCQYNSGVWKSTDGGATWARLGGVSVPSDVEISSVTRNSASTFFLLSTSNYGILKSTDSGTTFAPANGGIPANSSIFDTQCSTNCTGASSVLLTYVEGHGMYKSTDVGVTWNPSNTGLPSDVASVGGITRDGATTPPTFYIGSDKQGIYRSTDEGANWTLWSSADEALAVRGIARVNASTWYSRTLAGVYKTTDTGTTWTSSPVDMGHGSALINHDIVDPTVAYVATQWPYRVSNIYAAVWDDTNTTRIDTGLTGLTQSGAVVPDPLNASLLYATTNNRGVFKSANGGASWTAINGGLPLMIGQAGRLTIDPSNTQVMYLGLLGGGGIYKSTNAGASWSPAMSGLSNLKATTVGRVEIDTTTPTTLYASTDDGLYKSTNSGGSWSRVYSALDGGGNSLAVSNVRLNPSNTQEVFIANSHNEPDGSMLPSSGLLKSTDGGATWNNVLPGHFVDNVRVLNGGVVFAGLSDGVGQPAIMRSRDDGTTWQNFSVGLQGADIRTFGTSADNSRMMTAALQDGIYALANNPPRLINISTRGQVQTGFDVMIGGFVISGSTSKTVVIRATGPSLANYGVAGALANPTLQLVRSSDQTVIASNDDWGSASNASTIQASGFAPSNPYESAIYIQLAPGAYTAIVSGVGGGTGVGLVEVYEVDHPEVSLINISTRGKVLTGFDVMIGGFVVSGDGPQTLAVRAIGPSLTNYGVAGALANPQFQLVRSSDQTVITSNDDWGGASNAATLQASGFAPSNTYESAIYITLDPGAYTAIVSGVNNGTGVGLVEVYKVGP
jgi:photosystem II stability/assembly factor-like uncharacterized protein